jgi:preflagellin peptidase FlaK
LEVIFAAARVTLSLVVLVYASWSDYKTREVTSLVWAVYAPVALSLSLAELLLYNSSKLPLFGMCVGLTTLIAFLLNFAGWFGGADTLALICISLALPFFPEVLVTPIIPGGLSPLLQNLFPITILSNSVLIGATSGLYLLLRNLIGRAKSGKSLFEGTLAKESLGKKILVLVTGKKYPVATLKAKWHIYPMENIEAEIEGNELKRKLMIMPKDEGRDEVVARLSKAVDEGKISGGVWATPGLPMLIFVTVGLIIALSLGDIVWILVSHVFA